MFNCEKHWWNWQYIYIHCCATSRPHRTKLGQQLLYCFLRPTFSTKYPPKVFYASDGRQLIHWVYSGVSGVRAWSRHKKIESNTIANLCHETGDSSDHIIPYGSLIHLQETMGLRWYKEPWHCRLLLQTYATNHWKKVGSHKGLPRRGSTWAYFDRVSMAQCRKPMSVDGWAILPTLFVEKGPLQLNKV